MKRMIYFVAVILLTVIILPMLIVKGCGTEKAKIQEIKPQGGVKVRVYFHAEKDTREMDLEEYIVGVVAAEMPASFEPEALKAQAVAARTYAYSRMNRLYRSNDGVHDDADVCTDPGHCQAWSSKETAMRNWGILAAVKNWNKIVKAVNDTRNIVILYDGVVINPLFHSNSGGQTENAEDAWDCGPVPYLKSVISEGEESSKEFRTVSSIKTQLFKSKLKIANPNIKFSQKNILDDVKILDYTAGGRVKSIKAGNVVMKGTEFRTIFSLKSANFEIDKGEKDTLVITTLGNGHGVGMSQWGANYLAQKGESFEEILKYYYTGVELSKIKTTE